MRNHVMTAAAVALALSAWLYAAPVAPVADAAMNGDRDAVMALLKRAADVNGAQGDGMTALHWAAMHGDADLAATLLYAGANVRATNSRRSSARDGLPSDPILRARLPGFQASDSRKDQGMSLCSRKGKTNEKDDHRNDACGRIAGPLLPPPLSGARWW